MTGLSVVVAGGGSGGHVEPALAIAAAVQARGHRAVLLGTAGGIEARLVPARGQQLLTVPRVPMPRRPGADLLRLPGRLRGAVRAAAVALSEVDADVVIGVGGYVCAPAYLAARRRGAGIVVHEANPLPGAANRLGARLTQHVAVTVPGTPLRHAEVTGLPLRPEVADLDREAGRPAARATLGLDPHRPTLLVTGGSLGARRLNDAAVGAAARLTEAGVQVLHVAGLLHGQGVRDALPSGLAAPYVVLDYAEDMPAAYSAADLVLCRAGAGTCAELAAVGLPAVYVPLPIGNGEQRRNAEPTVTAGGGLLVDDAELTPERLARVVVPLLADQELLRGMSSAARRAQPHHAAGRVAEMAEEAAAGRRR